MDETARRARRAAGPECRPRTPRGRQASPRRRLCWNDALRLGRSSRIREAAAGRDLPDPLPPGPPGGRRYGKSVVPRSDRGRRPGGSWRGTILQWPPRPVAAVADHHADEISQRGTVLTWWRVHARAGSGPGATSVENCVAGSSRWRRLLVLPAAGRRHVHLDRVGSSRWRRLPVLLPGPAVGGARPGPALDQAMSVHALRGSGIRSNPGTGDAPGRSPRRATCRRPVDCRSFPPPRAGGRRRQRGVALPWASTAVPGPPALLPGAVPGTGVEVVGVSEQPDYDGCRRGACRTRRLRCAHPARPGAGDVVRGVAAGSAPVQSRLVLLRLWWGVSCPGPCGRSGSPGVADPGGRNMRGGGGGVEIRGRLRCVSGARVAQSAVAQSALTGSPGPARRWWPCVFSFCIPASIDSDRALVRLSTAAAWSTTAVRIHPGGPRSCAPPTRPAPSRPRIAARHHASGGKCTRYRSPGQAKPTADRRVPPRFGVPFQLSPL